MATEFQAYVGPRPFEEEDKDIFFGRGREVRDLLSTVIAHRLVLFYAQSGAGKTSLINAGLIPLLKEKQFEVFPVARVKGTLFKKIKSEEILNVFVFNTLTSWAEGDYDVECLAKMKLIDFLNEKEHKYDKDGTPLRSTIIFDQFEEIFSLYQDRWKDREGFFEQVSDAMKTDPLLRVVLVIREDFIAQLDPYEDPLPERMWTRFHMESMRRDDALLAIKEPVKKAGRSFAEGVAEKLVDDLLKTLVEITPGNTAEVAGEFIEAAQLQVLCQNLWQELPPDERQITFQHLEKYGNVEKVLYRFYEEGIRAAAEKAGVNETRLRKLFGKVLITEMGTRGMVYRAPEYTGDVPNAAIDVLENMHLIRAEWRAGARWYELTHDRFIDPIQSSNKDFNYPKGLLGRQSIAYFSMEIGLSSEIPTYAGGLGILAGDTIRSAADLNIPLVAVTLVSNKGYFRQILDTSGNQVEHTEEWNPARFMTPLAEEVSVKIRNRDVKIRAWLDNCKSLTGGYVPIIFLDTDVDGNEWEDRRITDFLYGGDQRYRLKQEMILGIGGVRMLDALGFNIVKYHMNEGHSSLLALELLRRTRDDKEKVKELCIFTTHTPVETGHDKLDYGLVEELFQHKNDVDNLRRFGGTDRFNTSLFALNLSNYVNGVTKRHSLISSEIFPGYKIQAITNGVHSYTWTSPYFRVLYDRYLPGWANEPELLARIGGIPETEIWEAHRNAKKALIDEVNKRTDVSMDYEVLTIGFARLMTAYKRATMVLSDLEMLKKINRRGKIQLIFAGKAHPRDEAGKQIIRDIFKDIEILRKEIKIVFLENYDMDLAAKMVSGVDIWLNTPVRPYEASGTSGMKAAHNGVVNFSVLDGWWIEGWIEGVTGWAMGPQPDEKLSEEEAKAAELSDLYNKLYYIIVPMYYDRKDEWIKLIYNSIGLIAYYFNSHRMMRRYVTHAYT